MPAMIHPSSVITEAVARNDEPFGDLNYQADALAVVEGEVVAHAVQEIAVMAVGPSQGCGIVRVPAPLVVVR